MPCNLNKLLGAACNLLQSENGQKLSIEYDLGEVPSLTGHPAKLSQAFYGVLDNAAKAVQGGGGIRVGTRRVADRVEVCIEDDGCGIADDVLPRVFDPFYSTRGVGAGTGLGLTVARDIVMAHQGEILLSSQRGQGTIVTLRFPVK
jgi:signal transduction histidine kinase